MRNYSAKVTAVINLLGGGGIAKAYQSVGLLKIRCYFIWIFQIKFVSLCL